jgi:hypothetical protein
MAGSDLTYLCMPLFGILLIRTYSILFAHLFAFIFSFLLLVFWKILQLISFQLIDHCFERRKLCQQKEFVIISTATELSIT